MKTVVVSHQILQTYLNLLLSQNFLNSQKNVDKKLYWKLRK